MPNKLNTIVNHFLSKIANTLPVMTASDEFYFLPRAESQLENFYQVETLSHESIQNLIDFTNKTMSNLSDITPVDIKEATDKEVFSRLLAALIREFDEQKIYQTDLTLYLKICSVSIDQAMHGVQELGLNQDEVLLSRLSYLPDLLNNARKNIRCVSAPNREIASEMVADTKFFIEQELGEFIKLHCQRKSELQSAVQKVLTAISSFTKFIQSVKTKPYFQKGKEYLEKVLTDSYGYSKGVDYVYQLGQAEFAETLNELRRVSRQINNGQELDWREMLECHQNGWGGSENLLEIYSQEIKNLKEFLLHQDLFDFSEDSIINVKETPAYMRSVRPYAAYNAPLNGHGHTGGIFFVTPIDQNLEQSEKQKLINSLHRDYWLIAGHETYPGHHVLDMFRERHHDSLRRQYENVMFYEGWAFYVEELLVGSDYANQPMQKIVQLKYQLWRALRVMLDIGLHTGKINLAQAVDELQKIGHPKSKALAEARRYTQTPGYQLAYTLGKHELKNLRSKFAPQMGLKNFHQAVLNAGQIPFSRLEKELEQASLHKQRIKNQIDSIS